MKKILLLSAVTVISGASMAQKLKSSDVPEAVRTAFNRKFQTASDVKWSKESENEYEAEFKYASKEHSANFNEKGVWLVTEISIKSSQLPAAILETLKKDFAGFKLEEAEQVETADKGSLYEVELEKGEKSVSVEFTPDGKVLSQKEKSEDEEDKD